MNPVTAAELKKAFEELYRLSLGGAVSPISPGREEAAVVHIQIGDDLRLIASFEEGVAIGLLVAAGRKPERV